MLLNVLLMCAASETPARAAADESGWPLTIKLAARWNRSHLRYGRMGMCDAGFDVATTTMVSSAAPNERHAAD